MEPSRTSKTSPASIVFRIGLIIMVLAVGSVGLMAGGEGSIFTGLGLILIGIFVVPVGLSSS